MKTLIVLFLTVFSVNAMAELDRGFDCTMAYKQSGAFTTSTSFHHWVGDGEHFTDEYLGVHTVSIKKIMKNVGEGGPAIYWRISVNDEDSSVALMEVGDWKGVQFTVPVNVTAPDSEDPPTFNSLTVSCDPAVFAG